MKEKWTRFCAWVGRHWKALLICLLGAAALYAVNEELLLLLVVMTPVVGALAFVFERIHAWGRARAEERSEQYRPLSRMQLLQLKWERRSMERAKAKQKPEPAPKPESKPEPAPQPEPEPKPEPKPEPINRPAPQLRTLFTAAGKGYAAEGQLKENETPTERVYTDCYGRTVLCLRERFPCFDSYDFLYEDRYYRWYFILQDGALTLVRTQDDSSAYTVTERITRAQWERCGLDGYNRDVFVKLGFEQYLS